MFLPSRQQRRMPPDCHVYAPRPYNRGRTSCRILSHASPQGLGAKRPISTVTSCRRTRCFGARLFLFFFYYGQTTADFQCNTVRRTKARASGPFTRIEKRSIRSTLVFYSNRVSAGSRTRRLGKVNP